MKRIVVLFITLVLLCACSSPDNDSRKVSSQTQSVSDLLNAASETSDAKQDSEYLVPQTQEELYEFYGEEPVKEAAPLPDGYSSIDYDLTVMSSTMVYSQVFDMVSHPENYLGKTVRMSGIMDVYQTEARNYYTCIIADATACCAQGIEFVRTGNYSYPADYPPIYSEIMVTGVFDSYLENGNVYLQLIDAVMQP